MEREENALSFVAPLNLAKAAHQVEPAEAALIEQAAVQAPARPHRAQTLPVGSAAAAYLRANMGQWQQGEVSQQQEVQQQRQAQQAQQQAQAQSQQQQVQPVAAHAAAPYSAVPAAAAATGGPDVTALAMHRLDRLIAVPEAQAAGLTEDLL